MPRIVRGQLALEIGDRLKDAGTKVHAFDQYRGEALEGQKRMVLSLLAAELGRLETLLRSCRSAKNSYGNYPALRRVLAEAGDRVYDLTDVVTIIYGELSDDADDWTRLGNRLLETGQSLRLVAFVPQEKTEEGLSHA